MTTTLSRNKSKSWTYPRPECSACKKVLNAELFQRRKHAWRPARDAWFAANVEKSSWIHANTRARKNGATQFMSLEEWCEVLAERNCHYCGLELHPSIRAIDHMIPYVNGGQHTRDNVVASCWNCNLRRDWERKTKFRKEAQDG